MADFYAIQGTLVRIDGHATATAEIDAQADRVDRLVEGVCAAAWGWPARAPVRPRLSPRSRGKQAAAVLGRSASALDAQQHEADRAAMATAETAVAQALDDLVEVAAGEGFLFRKAALDAIQRSLMLTVAVGAALMSAAIPSRSRRIVRRSSRRRPWRRRSPAGIWRSTCRRAGKDETGSLLAAMRVMQLNLARMMQREVDQRQSAQAKLVDAMEEPRKRSF